MGLSERELNGVEKRNFWLFVMDGSSYRLSQVFFEAGVLVPAFISQMTGSSFLIGLGSTIRNAGWYLPQIIVAMHVERSPFKKPLVIWGVATHLLGFMLLIPVMLFLYSRNPGLALVAFFLLYTVTSLGDGVAGVPWADMVGKCIKVTQRGRMIGFIQVIGGVAALGGGGVVAWVLSRESLVFPFNYSILIALYCLGILGTLIALYLVREPEGEASRESLSLRRYLDKMPGVIAQNPGLKKFLVTKILANCFMLAWPFYITFARNELGISGGMLGAFVSVQLIGSMGGSILLGSVGDAYGNRWVIRSALAASFVAPALGLFLVLGHTAFASSMNLVLMLFVYLMLGATLCGMWGFQNYLLELVDPGIRPTCVGLSNTIIAPVGFAPLLGGLIVNTLGYSWLFAFTAVLAIVALWVSMGLPEPRLFNRPGP